MLPEEMVEAAAAEAFSSAVPVKRCPSCQLMLPETADCFYFWENRFTARCKDCIRASRRENYRRSKENAAWDQRRREYHRELQRQRREKIRQDPVLAAKAREQRRRARERLRQDPVRYQAHLENRRIRENIKRRVAGKRPVPQRSNIGSVVDREYVAKVRVEVVQEAFRASGLSSGALAQRLGWMRANGSVKPDAGRVERRLGLKPQTYRGQQVTQEHVSYDTAMALIGAMDVDPFDYGL